MRVGAAFILAAGLGTRLKPFSDRLPKPAWPLFDRPIACHLLDRLAEAGVEEFIINLHHLPEALKVAVTPHLPLTARVRWSFEERILGTGGALAPWLDALTSGPFFLANADTHRSFSPAAMAAFHSAKGAEATLSLVSLPEGSQGPIEVDATGRIVRFLGVAAPKAGETVAVCDFTGIHLIEPTLLPEFARAAARDEKFCVNADVHKREVAAGRRYFGFLPADAGWSDLGTPRSYLEGHFAFLAARELPASTTGSLALEDFTTPEGGRVLAPSYVGVGATVETGAAAGPYAVLCPRARVSAGAKVERAVVWPGARVTGHATGIVTTWGMVMSAEGVVGRAE